MILQHTVLQKILLDKKFTMMLFIHPEAILREHWVLGQNVIINTLII